MKEWAEQKWFQLQCYYHYKTEMYDRSLTDMRSPYDKSEAYIVNSHNKQLSNIYAFNMFKQIRKIAEIHNLDGFIDKTDIFGNKYCYSVNGWINNYEHFDSNGELEWIKKYDI